MIAPRGFGWKKDPEDERDFKFARRAGLTRIEGRRMDLLIDYVRNQGGSSACVGHAIVAALELLYATLNRPVTKLSAWHAYWIARALDEFHLEDGGAFIRSGMRGMQGVGCCPESMLKIPISDDDELKAQINKKPSQACENAGITFADFRYERVFGGPDAVLDALQVGHPVVMGVNVTSAFVFCGDDETIPAPKRGDVRQGGHAFLLCGFDRHGSRIRALNSWSRDYGDDGFMWLEPEWIDDPTTQDVIALVATGPHAEGA